MTATIRNTALATLAAVLVVACTAQAQAQIRFRLGPAIRMAPAIQLAPPVVVTTPTVSHPIPYLGFDSFFDGSGEHVTAVQYGAAAWRIGLEPGDRIVAVNGIPLQYHGHGLQLLQASAYQGYVTLSVVDWRTGVVANRTLGLGSSSVALRSSSYVIHRDLRPSEILRRLPR